MASCVKNCQRSSDLPHLPQPFPGVPRFTSFCKSWPTKLRPELQPNNPSNQKIWKKNCSKTNNYSNDSNIFPNNYHANIVQSKTWCIAKTPPLFSNYRNQDTLGATSQDVPSPKVWLIMNGPPRCVLNQTTSFVFILEKNTLTKTHKKNLVGTACPEHLGDLHWQTDACHKLLETPPHQR